MIRSKYILISFVNLVLAGSVAAQESRIPIKGIVVDEKGRPLVRANVAFDSSEAWRGEKCVPTDYEVITDAGGQFFNQLSCKHGRGKTLLFTESATGLVDATFPIFAPFWPELRRNNSKFAGLPVELNGNDQIDLGKIPVQVWYNRVELFVSNNDNRPYYKTEDDWANFVIIVRDEKGDAVGSDALSTFDRERAVRVDRGSVNIALPEGTWTLELLRDWGDFDSKGRTLRLLAKTTIAVKKADVCLQARLVVK